LHSFQLRTEGQTTKTKSSPKKTEIKILAYPGLALLGFDHPGEYKWVPPPPPELALYNKPSRRQNTAVPKLNWLRPVAVGIWFIPITGQPNSANIPTKRPKNVR